MKKVAITIASEKTLKDTLSQLQHVVDKMDEKENRSMAAGLWEFIAKKPVIGKRKK